MADALGWCHRDVPLMRMPSLICCCVRHYKAKCIIGFSGQHAFEPRLIEPKSPLPGNGIFRAETKRPKRLCKVKDTVAETKLLNNLPIRGYWREPENLR